MNQKELLFPNTNPTIQNRCNAFVTYPQLFLIVVRFYELNPRKNLYLL